MNMIREILKTIDEYEGGYSNRPGDLGGLTRYGISHKAYPHVDIANLTKEQAITIAIDDYWNKLRCSEIISCRVRWKVFDIGFNGGVSTAARMLQHAVRVKEDGVVGQETLAAVNRQTNSSIGEIQILTSLIEQQMTRYVNIVSCDHSQLENLKGWARRAFDPGRNLS